MIIADLAFCCIDNPTLALIFGAGVGVAGFVFPVRPHRIPHDAGWHNPALMGAMLTEVLHTALCYFCRILPNILNMYVISLLSYVYCQCARLAIYVILLP